MLLMTEPHISLLASALSYCMQLFENRPVFLRRRRQGGEKVSPTWIHV